MDRDGGPNMIPLLTALAKICEYRRLLASASSGLRRSNLDNLDNSWHGSQLWIYPFWSVFSTRGSLLQSIFEGTILTENIGCPQTLIAIYRLIVMQYQTTSLESTARNAQNEPEAKAFFYIFHVLPEWLAAALILSVNLRKRFNTGLWGDRHSKEKKK